MAIVHGPCNSSRLIHRRSPSFSGPVVVVTVVVVIVVAVVFGLFLLVSGMSVCLFGWLVGFSLVGWSLFGRLVFV